ncbi:DUF6879 family protein [Plantactinospora sp. KLBMP9567]|uniref:DUF6879 family protein n=1 Tax=Plantactinospora sp. KLBMP9567 TaxID=3085900 RepID=UPI00298246D6|nr:DUF6879 family protein [Plantactinospora sp. KLBMP9567]MDW5322360.1 hypothetical protein [Plantactinospora sp. KLBMP9567]
MTRSTTLLRKIGWTLLTGFIGFAGSALFDEVLEVTLADQLIITIVIGGVTLLAQYLIDMERRFAESERLQSETTEGLRNMIQRGFESVDEATELMAELEQSAVRRELLKQVIRRSAHLTQAAPPLVQALAASETKRLADTLQSLSDGHEVFYDGEDREFLLALTRGTRVSLLATSWATINADGVGFEAGFWLSDLGARYLDLQRMALRRGVVIRRVFIIESATLVTHPELSRILALQKGAGVEVRLVDGSETPQDGGLSDFVIFDEQLCYDTTPVSRREAHGAPWRLTTRLVLNEETVRHRAERFHELWMNALPVSQTHVGEDSSPMVPGAKPLGST